MITVESTLTWKQYNQH